MLVHDGLELPAKDLHGRVPVHGFTIQQGSGSAIRGVEGSQRLPAFRARHPQVHGVLRVGREIDGLALFIQMDLQTTARGAEAAHRVGHGDGLGAGGQTAETNLAGSCTNSLVMGPLKARISSGRRALMFIPVRGQSMMVRSHRHPGHPGGDSAGEVEMTLDHLGGEGRYE